MWRSFQFSTLILCISLAGCQVEETPVATLAVQPTQLELGFPHFASLALDLEMLEPLAGAVNPRLMLHLLDDTGSVVRTFDHPLPGDWAPGTRQRYSVEVYQSALAPSLEPGDYRLTAGIYDETGTRWALGGDADEVHAKEYAMAEVRTIAGSDSAPKFFFSPTWMATEAGTDVQIVGRRWLRSGGVIRVAGIRAEGTVRLHLRIAPPDSQLEDLVLDEGHDEALLDVTTTCGTEPLSFRGIGTHRLEVAVSPGEGEAGGECEITLEPRYRVVTRKNLNTRTLALDLLAWRPLAAGS